MKKINLLIPAIILLSGCSSISQIEKESQSESHFKDAIFAESEFYTADDIIMGEKYRVYNEGVAFSDDIRETAVRKARDFCRAKGSDQKMVTVSEHGTTPPYLWGNIPRIEIIFVCQGRAVINGQYAPRPVQQYAPRPVEQQYAPRAAVVAPQQYAPTATVVIADKYERLSTIKKLLDDGVLTQDEFAIEKKKILAEK